MMGFIAAMLGSLTAYAAVYGLLTFMTWKRKRRVDRRVQALIDDFINRTEPRDTTPTVNGPPSGRNN